MHIKTRADRIKSIVCAVHNASIPLYWQCVTNAARMRAAHQHLPGRQALCRTASRRRLCHRRLVGGPQGRESHLLRNGCSCPRSKHILLPKHFPKGSQLYILYPFFVPTDRHLQAITKVQKQDATCSYAGMPARL